MSCTTNTNSTRKGGTFSPLPDTAAPRGPSQLKEVMKTLSTVTLVTQVRSGFVFCFFLVVFVCALLPTLATQGNA